MSKYKYINFNNLLCGISSSLNSLKIKKCKIKEIKRICTKIFFFFNKKDGLLNKYKINGNNII